MERRIQYAKTEDGVSIAFLTRGEGGGTPIVGMPIPPFSHFQKMYQIPLLRRITELRAKKRTVVSYDNRGSGLSERDVTDYSLEAHLLDLQAVVDRLSLDRFILEASFQAGPVAITYAARHPERVSRLVLRTAFAAKVLGAPATRAVLGLLEADWKLFTETMARWIVGSEDDDLARQMTVIMRECVTKEAALAMYRAIDQFDAEGLLGELRPPTLVVHVNQVPEPAVAIARGLASRIPDARLAVVDDMESAISASDEFADEGEEASPPRGLAAEDVHIILFTDVEGSTALTDRLGDSKARNILREHERTVREALKSHGGFEVKALGDGFMTSFSSATKALECAIAMQRAFAQHNESAEEPIKVRIGLNAGEPIAEEDDLFGTAVNLAARICGHAEAGQILASEAVRQIVAGKKFPFSDLGETALRGFEDRVHIYQVSWRQQ